MPDPRLVAVNHVLADRAEDFEQWLRTVVVPAVRSQRPELEDRWHVLRSVQAEDGTVVFVFLFQGGTPADWDLGPLLESALGPEGAAEAFAAFGGMLSQEQSGWLCEPVRFDPDAVAAVPAG